MGVMNRIPLLWASFLCVACWVLAFSMMADSAMTISDQTTYNSPSTCQYPCLPPPASVINCPPPPSPPSSTYSPPSSTYSPPYQPGPGYYYTPPAGYYPPQFPSYQAPPPPDPILPYFPFLYRHPPPSPSSSTNLSFETIRSLAVVILALCFIL